MKRGVYLGADAARAVAVAGTVGGALAWTWLGDWRWFVTGLAVTIVAAFIGVWIES